MSTSNAPSRRRFIASAFGAGASAVVGLGLLRQARAFEKEEDDEATPLEDLMREHAVLERLMLVYDEAARRLDDASAEIAPEITARAAKIVHEYIEDHHERDEEQYVFPRLRTAKREVALVDTLLAQHEAGRRVTARIVTLSTASTLRDAEARRRLADALRSFVRMYRPHAAHENTVLFPAFRAVLREGEYERLREDLEKKERATYGEDLYERVLAEVVSIEKTLGLDVLSKFTPG
jgi:hemerythrin-like domain-containing protein